MDDYFDDCDIDYIFDSLCMDFGLTDEQASEYIHVMLKDGGKVKCSIN